MRAPRKKRGREVRLPTISARLNGQVALEADTDGAITASFDGLAVELGRFSAAAADRAHDLLTGLALDSFSSDGNAVDKEIDLLVRRLARRGLLEYRLGGASNGGDQVCIEPQVPDYWPQTPKLRDTDTIVLSRFAYLRRRGNEMVMESPRAGALFRIGDPKIATALAVLAAPQKIGRLRKQDGFPGVMLLALLVDCQILLKVDPAKGGGLRPNEGDDNLVLWDFHDLLFHTHSTEGRQANPLGGLYPHADVIAPPPAVRPRWPGKKIDLRRLSAASVETISPVAKLLRARHSTRDFDDRQPITLAELAQFLDGAARVQSKWKSRLEFGEGSPVVAYTSRPYPAAGSSYELEFYLAVANCAGLERGFYHYDADQHALVPIATRPNEFEALLRGAEFAMDAAGAPQILITIAARFGRISWKYSSIAYALILKDVGVLMQTLYLMATDLGLGGCAIGTGNIDLFARMTGIDFHVEGPVGQFAIGRGLKPGASE
ncbi:SagB/ThcOx family dehydrogenase [Bradyrhizobium sp.]|uniref:SagB/ThcOx family dehydrogenase n=1 Tax=Bradyrhizobium sp. TaxID=376 RepID=UPI003C75AA1B